MANTRIKPGLGKRMVDGKSSRLAGEVRYSPCRRGETTAMAYRKDLITDDAARALKVPDKGSRLHSERLPKNHYIRLWASGVRSYMVVARGPGGKQTWFVVGNVAHATIKELREDGDKIIGRIKQGLAPREAAPETLRAIAEVWFARVGDKAITAAEKRRRLDRYLLPRLGDMPLNDVRKVHVTKMLDTIEDKHGARTADMVCVDLQVIARWHAERTDGYVVPFLSMAKRDTAGSRERTLTDDEIRLVWAAAGEEKAGPFGAIIKVLLTTAQRADKVLTMTWDAVDETGKWTLPKSSHASAKGHPAWLILPGLALDAVRAQPRLGARPWIFPAYRGDGPIRGTGMLKASFDTMLPAGFPAWTLHDLRRTARTLMARACRPAPEPGDETKTVPLVPVHIGELALGHKLQGVLAVYNRHDHASEINDALAILARLIEQVLDGGSSAEPLQPRLPGNVVPLRPGDGVAALAG
jgi:integrase